VTSNTGVLNAGTAWTDYPNGAKVNIASTGNLNIATGDFLDADPFVYAPGLGSGPANLNVTVDGMTWHFDAVQMIVHQLGAVVAEWTGTFMGGGGLEPGALAYLSQSCDQIIKGGPGEPNCSNTQLTTKPVQPIPEPTALALLGGTLLWFGLWLGMRKNG
jgi:hypothetical protein